MSAWTPQEEAGLVNYLVDRMLGNASGRDVQECVQNHPRDVYFLGNLRSRAEANAIGSLPAELLSKLAPVALAVEAKLGRISRESTANVTVMWTGYYRVFPTRTQQRRHQEAGADVRPEGEPEDAPRVGEEPNTEEPESTPTASPEPRRRARREIALGARDRLAIRYKRVSGSASASIVLGTLSGERGTVDLLGLQQAITQELERCRRVVADDPETIRRPAGRSANFAVPSEALQSDDTFVAWQRTHTEIVVPNWAITINGAHWSDVEAAQSRVLALELVNDSTPVDDPFVDAYIFEAALSADFQGCELQPFKVELAPKGFRFDPFIWGRGHNCEALRTGPNRIETRHSPICQQARYVTRTAPPARFEDLARDPVPVLTAIWDAMQGHLSVWAQQERTFAATPGWVEAHKQEFDRDRQIFVGEIDRFREGLRLIETDADVRLAFQLTNETFATLGRNPQPSKTKDSWRLFQIVFLVSQILGIHALKFPSDLGNRERETVDVIYFPTGGGKTEAYLGTIVFHCFFDRLRGKTAGVTSWTRFPLRLLTLQQTQRMADAIGVADLIRSRHADPRLSRGCDGFSVGYFVGAEATPNELEPPADGQLPNVAWSRANDPQLRQKWKRIGRCPSCKTNSIALDLDPGTVRLVHRCTNAQCAFPRGVIPVFITDHEIFRYLPSVIVGTVDKLAALGNQRKFALVLGQVDGRCQQHGYYKGICCQKGCKDKKLLRAGIPNGVSGPTLLVQDELHLLKEGLGTFDSHYETFLQSILIALGAAPIKFIASSATIEQFERQIEHLYGKNRSLARIFPGPGPTLASSFYAETLQHAQRVYVGLLPHNKTLFNAVLELIETYHRELLRLRTLTGANPWGGRVAPGTPQWTELVDFYWVSLNYFLAGRDLASIHTDLEGDTNPKLQADGLPPLAISELLGNTSTDDVTATLDLLERPAAPSDGPRAILATSMVSHGVDIDRLNAMLFYGMPRLTAEYIQASSRVGRSHVGLVLVCLHPARERDQSHFMYFRKYHEYLGQLVEPVAINRWATFSIDRTLPGLFMAILLQRVAHRPGMTNPNSVYMLDYVKKAISSGALTANDFIPLLESAYLVPGDTGGPGREAFRPKIPRRVRQFLDHILQTSGTDPFVSSALIPSPMRSLREVQEAITIELDSEGSDWARMQ